MLQYSPLCDSHFLAYLAYLLASVGDGSNLERLVLLSGGGCGREFDSGDVGAGGHFRPLDGGSVGAIANDAVARLRYLGFEGRVDGNDNSGIGDAGERVNSVERDSSCFLDSSSDPAACVGRDGVFQRAAPTVVKPLVGPRGGPSIGRGLKYERNSRKRAAKAVASAKVSVFAECTTLEERKELVAQRVDRFKLENKVAIAKAQVSLARLENPESSSASDASGRKHWRKRRGFFKNSGESGTSSGFSSDAHLVNAECIRLRAELVKANTSLDKALKEAAASRAEVLEMRDACEREMAMIRRDFDPKSYVRRVY